MSRFSSIVLFGSSRDVGLLRVCMQCAETVSPNGGVQTTATKWICSSCWKSRFLSQAMADRNRAKA